MWYFPPVSLARSISSSALMKEMLRYQFVHTLSVMKLSWCLHNLMWIAVKRRSPVYMMQSCEWGGERKRDSER